MIKKIAVSSILILLNVLLCKNIEILLIKMTRRINESERPRLNDLISKLEYAVVYKSSFLQIKERRFKKDRKLRGANSKFRLECLDFVYK
jgi:hypothetical protein